MKFNNDLKCPSARSAIVCVVLSIAITAIAIVWYLSSTTVNPSFSGFFIWYNSTFHAFLTDEPDDIFEVISLFIMAHLFLQFSQFIWKRKYSQKA